MRSVLAYMLACGLLLAQTKSQFEVASVKPAAPPSGTPHGPWDGGPGTANPGQVTFSNQSLMYLLLEEHGLQVRHESRETQAYALTVGKNGSKMKAYPMELQEGMSASGQPNFTGVDKDGFFIPARSGKGNDLILERPNASAQCPATPGQPSAVF